MQTFTDLYRYRFVLASLVGKNLKVMYRSMSLGLLWTLLNPIVMIVTLSTVWIVIFGNPASVAASIIVALIPYNFAVYCLTGCVHAIPGNAALVKKVGFPRQILPVSIILTHLIHFAIQSVLVVVVLLIFPPEHASFGLHLLWLLPIFLVLVAFCIGAGMLIASLNVIYRDVQYIVESLFTVLFWLCPIVWTDKLLSNSESVSATARYAVFSNPLSGIISAYRYVLFDGRSPDLETFGIAVVGTAIIGFFGLKTFWKHEKEFADLI